MSRLRIRREKKLGPVLVVSLLCHLLLVLLSTQLHLFMATTLKQAPVYYVDLLDLPAAQPAQGTPAPSTATPVHATPTAPKAPPQEMKLPVKMPKGAPKAVAVKTPVTPVKPTADRAASAREFEERLTRLQREAEAQHEAAALEALQKKVAAAAAKGKPGTPGGVGKESGSDYAGYVRSRLEDAFRMEDTFKPDRSKVVAIRLVLNKQGRITTLKMVQSSNDKMFNDAVVRAITRAEREFHTPPGGGVIELNFIFKPQEVSKK